MKKKHFVKTQHPFVRKILSKLGIEGNLLNLIKDIYEKPTANITLHSERFKCFPPLIGNKTRMFTLTTSIQHCIGGPNECNKARKRNKRHEYCKGISKTLLIHRSHVCIHGTC